MSDSLENDLTEQEKQAFEVVLEHVRNSPPEVAVEIITDLATAMAMKVLEMTGDPKEDVRRLRDAMHTMPPQAILRALQDIKAKRAELLIYPDARH